MNVLIIFTELQAFTPGSCPGQPQSDLTWSLSSYTGAVGDKGTTVVVEKSTSAAFSFVSPGFNPASTEIELLPTSVKVALKHKTCFCLFELNFHLHSNANQYYVFA